MRPSLVLVCLAALGCSAARSTGAGASNDSDTTSTSQEDGTSVIDDSGPRATADALAQGGTDGGSSGTAADDDLSYTGSLAGSGPGYRELTLTLDGAERLVGVYVPDGLPPHPALVIAFHGTSGNPSDFLDEMGLRGFAESANVLVVAPQALERNGGSGEVGDPDHWAGSDASWGTSWNLADDSPETNDDLRLVRVIVKDLRASWGIDADRVYTFGHSNGAFMAYHTAAALSDRIAGFAENAGGAVRCANRGRDDEQFRGTGTTCDALSAEPGFPSCDGELQPIEPNAAGRVPWGFLAHHNDDAIVSVSWTCTLATAMGDRAEVYIKAPDGDSFGHSVVTDFPTRAWAFLSQHSRLD